MCATFLICKINNEFREPTLPISPFKYGLANIKLADIKGENHLQIFIFPPQTYLYTGKPFLHLSSALIMERRKIKAPDTQLFLRPDQNITLFSKLDLEVFQKELSRL